MLALLNKWNMAVTSLKIQALLHFLHLYLNGRGYSQGALQMASQPVSSIFLCSPLPSGTWWTPYLSIPWCCLPTSFSVCIVFFSIWLCLARWFCPDLMNGRHVHTTSIWVFLRWSGGLCGLIACWILAHTSSLVMWSLYKMHSNLCSTSFPRLVFFSAALLWGSLIHKHTGKWIWQGSTSVISWNWEKCSCHSTLVLTLSVLLLFVISWRVSLAWNPC